jgi:hypothetical protein
MGKIWFLFANIKIKEPGEKLYLVDISLLSGFFFSELLKCMKYEEISLKFLYNDK